jgi:hypothetical protein
MKLRTAIGGILAAGMLILAGCNDPQQDNNNNNNTTVSKPAVAAPDFNADSAYHYVEQQVAFGPRVPNTTAHDKAGEWLIKKMKQYAEEVEVQHGQVTTYDGKKLNITNIFGYINPKATRKILLCAHWDSRPWADQDSVDIRKPIDGANDGASGVGVLIEMARVMKGKDPNTGVVIFLTDAEDYGKPDFDSAHEDHDSYCLGTQYWARNLDKNKYVADYGIVLDMVGAGDARFLQEANSLAAAKDFVYKVWSTAYSLGYSNYFIMQQSSWGVIDDHVYISQLGGVPSIDIVDYDASRPKGFAWYWHTHGDDMKVIDRRTLKAVGHTLLTLIYNH